MNRFSILQDKKQCYVCGSAIVHTHEVFFGNNRQNSIKDGCCVYLCPRHHNMSNLGVHFNHELDIKLKKIMQQRWCEYYNKTIEEFRERYGKSWL